MRNVLALTFMSILLVNCSEVGFEKVENASVTQADANGDATGTVDQPGTNTGTGSGTGTPGTGAGTGAGSGTPTTPIVYPKLIFVGPPCVRGSACQVTFRLETVQMATVEFDWQTNDTLYQQTAPAGKVYAQPGVHYVPTSGHVTFAPGETSKTVYVQNINPYNYEVTIGVRMTGCRYGALADLCSKFFR